MFKLFRKWKRLKELCKNEARSIKLYHKKKLTLINVHRENKNKELIKQLVTEINLLAELLEKPTVDIDNISDTLRAYPSLVKEK